MPNTTTPAHTGEEVIESEDREECVHCGESLLLEDVHTRNGDPYCEQCADNIDSEDNDNEDGEGDAFRNPSLSSILWRDTKKGTLALASPTFGIELEADAPSSEDRYNFAQSIPRSVGIVSDGSLEGNATLEIVSPILAGKKGEELIRDICRNAKNSGLTVNRSCGFHVHIGADGFYISDEERATMGELVPIGYKVAYKSVDSRRIGFSGLHDSVEDAEDDARELRDNSDIEYAALCTELGAVVKSQRFERLRLIMALYWAYEDVLLAMVPKTRRGGRWSRSVNNSYPFEELVAADSYQALEKLWYSARSQRLADDRKKGGKYHESRYHGVNFHRLFSGGGTFEIRYHSATLNADKILGWVALHQYFARAALGGKVSLDTVRDAYASRNGDIAIRVDSMKTLLSLPAPLVKYVRSRVNNFTS